MINFQHLFTLYQITYFWKNRIKITSYFRCKNFEKIIFIYCLSKLG